MFRRLGLSGKCATSLLLAAAPPFLALLLILWVTGSRRLLEQRGLQHEREAAMLIDAIHQAADTEAEKLRVWVQMRGEVTQYAAERTRTLRLAIPAVIVRHALLVDEIWPSLPPGDPQLATVLDNPASRAMKEYQSIEPAAAEMMLTDSIGRIIASSHKTTDYYQADEPWWSNGAKQEDGHFWKDNIHFDEGLKAYTVDLVLPIRKDGNLVGVLKLSVQLDRLIQQAMAERTVQGTRWQMLLRDGQILAGTRSARLPAEWHQRMREGSHGWLSSLTEVPGFSNLAGYAEFNRRPSETNAYLIVSLPVRGNPSTLHPGLLALAFGLLLLCVTTGLWLLRRGLLHPLQRIGWLLDSMATLARLRNRFPDDKSKLREQQREVEGQLHDIQQLRTGDQLESMARETATLVSRVLRYQHDLEKEEDQP